VTTLRDWQPADLAVLPSLLDPARPWHDTNGPYFGRMTPLDVQRTLTDIARTAATAPAELPTPRRTMAVDHDGPLIGQVSWYWECQATDWRRLGIVIYDEHHWGHGHGTEALRQWTSYLFASTDALRLDFATYSGNPVMIAIGRRLGFTEEARFRSARRWSGGVHDSVALGVLREEWQARHGTRSAPLGEL
jgi:RimJ/RimL family protein N-acetyltransferase